MGSGLYMHQMHADNADNIDDASTGDEILNPKDSADLRTSKDAATRNPTAWSRIFCVFKPYLCPSGNTSNCV